MSYDNKNEFLNHKRDRNRENNQKKDNSNVKKVTWENVRYGFIKIYYYKG